MSTNNGENTLSTSATPIAEWGTWVQTLAYAQPFDLIEINRYYGLYQHWVMYLGKGYVIHVTQVKDRTEGPDAEKRIDKLSTLVRQDYCRVNNLVDYAKEKGSDARRSDDLIFDAIKDIVPHRTLHNINYADITKVVIVPYAVTGQNCEFYGTLWRYGTGFSKQVDYGLSKNIPPEKMMASVELLADLEPNIEESDMITEFVEASELRI